jgi:hypothetical protein
MFKKNRIVPKIKLPFNKFCKSESLAAKLFPERALTEVVDVEIEEFV